jgi:aspartate-semialdehyde dehydrogenase
MERMRACGDFTGLDATFFSTSKVGGDGPVVDGRSHKLADAMDLACLAEHEVILTCQGGPYTKDVYPRLRGAGWKGHWIDAASALRMQDDAVLVLDPVNMPVIRRALDAGGRLWCGPNCTVSVLLFALQGLLEADLVEWVSTMTYQAASGAGAEQMRELVAQWAHVAERARPLLADESTTALAVEGRATATIRDASLPTKHFGYPLAGNLLPWIDTAVDGGQTREEWKSHHEGNKILGRTGARAVPIDGACVRVGAMRCHSHGVTLKLRRDLPVAEIGQRIAAGNPWVKVVPNEREATLARLTPAAITGTLDIAVGRVRKLQMGPEYVSLFAVGDQLLWGAAEPLRRMLQILRGKEVRS